MSAEKKKKKAASVDHVFTGDLSLRRVTEVKNEFAALVDSAKNIRASFVDVEDVDLSFVQVLCSAHRTALEAGKKFEITGSLPESFLRLIEDTGLNRHVGCSFGCEADCPWLNQ